MKIVIPYRDKGGPELKYCLRGIEKYVVDPEVAVVGDEPAGLRGIRWMAFNERSQPCFKAANIFDKIMWTQEREFLFFNDDHFLLHPFAPDTFHYSGTIKTALKSCRSSYRRTLQNTLDAFGDIKNFDTHCPIFYKREGLEAVQALNLNWNKPGGFCIKSIYCHLAGIDGTEYPDLKIRDVLPSAHTRQLIENREYFSTSDRAIDYNMINVLEEIYPSKSKYEL